MNDDDRQQQADECEALSSIYPNEFLVVPEADWASIASEAEWPTDDIVSVISLLIQPQEDDPSKIHVSVDLFCGMTSSYPTNANALTFVRSRKGLSNEQAEELNTLARTQSTENSGMPSVFTIASSLQDWLQENNLPGQDGSMYSDMLRRMQKKTVEEQKELTKQAIRMAADSESKDKSQLDPEELERIRKRQAGVQVTTESFLEWKRRFDAEMQAMEASKRDKQHGETDGDRRTVTGKQFFVLQQQQGLRVEDEEEGEEEDEEAIPGYDVDGVDVNEEQLLRALAQFEGNDDDDDEDDSDFVGDEDDEDDELMDFVDDDN